MIKSHVLYRLSYALAPWGHRWIGRRDAGDILQGIVDRNRTLGAAPLHRSEVAGNREHLDQVPRPNVGRFTIRRGRPIGPEHFR
jgi:hypothetical protein